jgi:hypothetical protein
MEHSVNPDDFTSADVDPVQQSIKKSSVAPQQTESSA